MGESKFIHPSFRYNAVRFFFFYFITFFSKCQKNRINKILEVFKIILVQLPFVMLTFMSGSAIFKILNSIYDIDS